MIWVVHLASGQEGKDTEATGEVGCSHGVMICHEELRSAGASIIFQNRNWTRNTQASCSHLYQCKVMAARVKSSFLRFSLSLEQHYACYALGLSSRGQESL